MHRKMSCGSVHSSLFSVVIQGRVRFLHRFAAGGLPLCCLFHSAFWKHADLSVMCLDFLGEDYKRHEDC